MSAKDKVVAITGASAGIGRATALRLAGAGAAVVLCARRRERLDALVSDITALGGRAVAEPGDVTRDEHMAALVARAVDTFGRLDVMMCNAGFGVSGPIDAIDPHQMQRLMDVNYFGSYHAARAALPVFRRQGAGHVIFVSSIVGKRGVPYMGAYAATKFAQVGLAECLRAEVAGTGIHVSVVFPISTETEFFDVMQRETGSATRALGPRQTADEVAAAIVGAIERPVAEVYPYFMSRGLVWLNTFAPAWCDHFVKRFGRKPISPAESSADDRS